MASVGDHRTVYQALLVVRTELLKKLVASGVDPNALIVKAKVKGVIGSIQASAKVAQSAEEKAEQLVNQLLEAVGTDETKAEEFVQLLEENSLGEIATFLRRNLMERLTGGLDPSQESHHPPDAGYQPKSEALEPVSMEDSGVAKDMSQLALQNSSTSPAFDRTQRKLPGRKDSGTPFEAVPGGLVYAEQEHIDNLPVTSENAVESVADTQPHLEKLQAVLGDRSASVLPETKSLLQTNQELQAQLAVKTSNEERLQEQLEKMGIEKKQNEEKLKQKEKELQEKESQIKQLKDKVKHLQQKLQSEKESNVKEKTDLEEKIRHLQYQLQQLQEKEEKFNKEKFRLIEDKHGLELKIQTMHTEEERLKRLILEEKCKVAELHTQAERDKTERTVNELKQEHARQMEEKDIQHQNSVTEMQQKIKELEKQNSTMEMDTS